MSEQSIPYSVVITTFDKRFEAYLVPLLALNISNSICLGSLRHIKNPMPWVMGATKKSTIKLLVWMNAMRQMAALNTKNI
jgi:hypothetical protein